MNQDQQLRESLEIADALRAGINASHDWCEETIRAEQFLRKLTATQQAAPSRGEEDWAYGYAKRLAESIWERHYKDVSPNWKVLDTLIGILTQIDNMAAGLLEASTQREQPADSNLHPMTAQVLDARRNLAAMPDGGASIQLQGTDRYAASKPEPQAQAGEPEGLPYGIIDPDYARVYTQARIVAWQYGYACVMHGSFTRDLDLLLVPWTDQAKNNHEQMLKLIADACGLRFRDGKEKVYESEADWTDKPNGRKACSLFFRGFGDRRWVDISVLPAGIAKKDAALQACITAIQNYRKPMHLRTVQEEDAAGEALTQAERALK